MTVQDRRAREYQRREREGEIDPGAVTASWLTLQRDLLQLSTRSAQTIVPQASHVSLIADARYAPSVVAAIRSVFDALKR